MEYKVSRSEIPERESFYGGVLLNIRTRLLSRIRLEAHQYFMNRRYAQVALKSVGLRKEKLELALTEEDIILRHLFYHLYIINSYLK